MSTGFCRSVINRNFSSSIVSSTNQTNFSDASWITNGISLIIFILAFLGNTAALIVMFASRGPIRLTNNKYLANLACADLLRACFMPFTIIARMKRNFIFGRLICKILPIVQGLSVAVDVFTLVCISVERYLAICRPLLILKLQSLRCSHLLNGLVLFLIWFFGLLTALPNFFIYNLCFLPKLRHFKCEKSSPANFDERIYIIVLDILCLLMPMGMMIILYTLIILKMSRKNTAMQMRSFQNNISTKSYSNTSSSSVKNIKIKSRETSQHLSLRKSKSVEESTKSGCLEYFGSKFRRENLSNVQPISRMDRHRRKALKLLIVLIIEFFVCWTPLYIYHTIGTFQKDFYRSMPNFILDLILLFSFASASCNPITYYFMSQRYRSVLYANLSSLCFNKNRSSTFYQKNREIQNRNRNFVDNQMEKLSGREIKPTAIDEQIKSNSLT